jgi:hypothetical protein
MANPLWFNAGRLDLDCFGPASRDPENGFVAPRNARRGAAQRHRQTMNFLITQPIGWAPASAM